jgi:hypothetical protein
VFGSGGEKKKKKKKKKKTYLTLQFTNHHHPVGIKYYAGLVTKGEMVHLVREPANPYDRNAIAVVNGRGEQVGHIKREHAYALAGGVDPPANQCSLEGTVVGQADKVGRE